MKIKNQATLAALLLAAAAAHAGPGALEINQACVADGCFPGDSAGFPVTIVDAGSYLLTSNLTVPTENTTAIQVDADNVSIDMAGFAIVGVVTCTGETDGCSPSGSGNGISATVARKNLRIAHGTINGMGFAGIRVGSQSYVEDILAENNWRAGVWLESGGTIRNSSANHNGMGFQVIDGRLEDVNASRNGLGINCARCVIERAVVVDNTANSGVGINDGYGSIIRSSIVARNQIGIYLSNGGTRVIDNQILTNIGLGIHAGATTPPDIVTATGPLTSSLSGNHLTENNGGNTNPQIGGGGSWIEVAANFCGSDASCP